MSNWEDFKNFTKQIATSKPVRWIVSGIAGLTSGGIILNLLMAALPATDGFLALDILLTLTWSLLVARLTSTGYTTVEKSLVEVETLKTQFGTHLKDLLQTKRKNEAQDIMTKQLVADIKEQNQNNQSFYLQQMGIIRFCEALLENLSEDQRDPLIRLLEPPSLAQVTGRRPPTMLQSMIINPDDNYDSDDSEGELKEIVTQIPQQQTTPPLAQSTMFESFYQGAQSFYGSFWPAPRQLDAGQNELAFLDSIPRSDSNETETIERRVY